MKHIAYPIGFSACSSYSTYLELSEIDILSWQLSLITLAMP